MNSWPLTQNAARTNQLCNPCSCFPFHIKLVYVSYLLALFGTLIPIWDRRERDSAHESLLTGLWLSEIRGP